MKLFPTDYVVVTKKGTPLRYSSGSIGLWHKDNLSEIRLEDGEKLIPSNKIREPFKSELITQIKSCQKPTRV